jgi:serine/threonine protein kinase
MGPHGKTPFDGRPPVGESLTPSQVLGSGLPPAPEATLDSATWPATAPVRGAVPAGSGWPKVPGFEVLGELGRGGMGVVYQARQCGLNRLVALKMMRSGAGASAEELARFRAEAEALARLHHPNIVQVHHIGEAGGHPYIALEFVPGGSLAEQLAGAPLPPRRAAELTQTLARAIQAAHEQGVIHRDLKPANILLQKTSTTDHTDSTDKEKNAGSSPSVLSVQSVVDFLPKITDFGLAKLGGPEAGQTQTGAILGTPSYMAPEQAWGKSNLRTVGPAADIYALGAILYEMLTGRAPFKAETSLDTLQQVVSQEPVPPSRLQPKVPRDLETICLACLHKQPHRRYATAEALAQDLGSFLEGKPIRARPVGAWERAAKWVRRRPAGAALVAGVALSLLGGTAVATYFAIQSEARAWEAVHEKHRADEQAAVARHNEREANLNLRRARTNLREANKQRARAQSYSQKLLEALDAMTEVGDPDLVDLETNAARNPALWKALRFYEGLPHNKEDPDPAVRREMARTFSRTAAIKYLLGMPDQARADNLQALTLAQQLSTRFPEEAGYRRDWAQACHVQVYLCDAMKRPREALAAAQRERSLREALPLDQPQDRWDLARVYHYLALHGSEERIARELSEKALALIEKADRQGWTVQSKVLRTEIHLHLGRLSEKAGRPAEAEAAYEQAEESGAVAVRHARWVGQAHSLLAKAYHHLAAMKWAAKSPQDAEELYLRALDLRKQVVRFHPNALRYLDELISSHQALADLYVSTGRPAKGETHVKERRAVENSSALAKSLQEVVKDLTLLNQSSGGGPQARPPGQRK